MLSIKYVRLLKIKKIYYYYYYYYYYPRPQVLKTVIDNSRLCDAIATMTRTLRTQYIDPTTIQPLVANRPIPVDKGEGAVRPIGVNIDTLKRDTGAFEASEIAALMADKRLWKDLVVACLRATK